MMKRSFSIILAMISCFWASAQDCVPDTIYRVKVHATPNRIHPIGTIDGCFSVGPTTQVYFSQGNLQYRASLYSVVGDVTHMVADGTIQNGEWRFAPNQYDYIGNAPGNINATPTQVAWIDLFGRGTSGYEGYYPYLNSLTLAAYPSALQPLAGTYYDWGVYNPISNGGNIPGVWRTLSKEEWQYLLETRPNALALRTLATVCGVKGYVLLPDNWVLPDGLSCISGTTNFTDNVYHVAQWMRMENSGAVFLPLAGSRTGMSVSGCETVGMYWVSSAGQSNGYADYLRLTGGIISPNNNIIALVGLSVRLVQDKQ